MAPLVSAPESIRAIYGNSSTVKQLLEEREEEEDDDDDEEEKEGDEEEGEERKEEREREKTEERERERVEGKEREFGFSGGNNLIHEWCLLDRVDLMNYLISTPFGKRSLSLCL